ncbi:MAG: hypothetical protein GX895_05885 [Clostridiales bacterium]|uniref:hypothetical protein n=1 Tax=Clostridium sp. N3C TaxID=1776758 RepID=UPI00092DEAF3|nr:hypothetical protein [Clostridium sp. N3C]NLZ48313.1 hypothetical protein [Clostridiales bacterium]SCN22991.1 hypothetical protein N3C_1057 [Clostridium sp. N3C]
MKRVYKNISAFILLIIMIFSTTGCQKINDLKLKMGLINNDFEYIKEGKADKIIIQSTRDLGFRFVVTDKSTIGDLYDILSSAKKVDQKSELQPDYIFEIHENGMVHKFNYITGLDKNDYGNLYSDDAIYIVSKRIDHDIIRNLWNYRAPREFKVTYYGSIIQFLRNYTEKLTANGNKVGIDLSQDVEGAKYLLSTEIEEFKENLSKTISTAELVDNNSEEFDVLVTIKTQGYKTTVYKAIITVNDKIDKSETKYYIYNKYENGEWEINVTDTKPNKF